MWQSRISGMLIVLGMMLAVGPLFGQDPTNPFGGAPAGGNPFGGAPPADAGGGNPFGGAAPSGPPASNPFGSGAAPAGPPATNPFGGGAAPSGPAPGSPFDTAAPAAASETQTDPTESDEKNPIVLTIRDSNPSTPQDLMFAVHALFEIGRTDEAKQYLTKLLAAKPDRDQLEAFLREYGSPFFRRLAEDHRMDPEGEAFGKAVRDAAYDAARDPERLREATARLSSPNPAIREIAIDQLRGADAAAAPVLLEALGDSQRSEEHAAIRSGIVAIGAALLPAMLGATETPDESLRAQVHRVLGEYRTPRAVPLLVGPAANPLAAEELRESAGDALLQIVGRVPSQREAVQYLVGQVREYYDGALPGQLDYEDQLTLWRWDPEQQTVTPHRYPAIQASRAMAARLAQDLLAFAPEDPSVQRLLLAALLDFAKTDAGLDQPLPRGEGSAFALAAAAGTEAIEQVLEFTMQKDYGIAATAAAEVLGAIGDVSLVAASDGRPRPLVRALRHPNRRVRLAAAEAVMQLDPQEPYAGSSYLPEALGYFARTVGSRRVLVAHPRVERAQTLVGMLSQLGYEADSAATGNTAFRMATKNPDYEFVLLSDSLTDPASTETLSMFRRDPRTAGLAVGLMAREANMQHASDTADSDPLCLAFPRPHDTQLIAFQTARLVALSGRRSVDSDERLDQALRALEHLAHLAANPQRYAFYDLYRQQEALRTALFVPASSVEAAPILGILGSPEAQRALVTLASQHAIPLAQRQAAAEAFGVATRQHGVLLTRDEILRQYDRYNRSADQDAGTQQVLGSILDSIERPSQQTLAEDQSVASP